MELAKERLLPHGYYGGLPEEVDTSPFKSTLKLLYADKSYKKAKEGFITRQIDNRKDVIFEKNNWEDVKSCKLSLQKRVKRANRAIKDSKVSLSRFHGKIKDHIVLQFELASEIQKVAKEKQRSSRLRNEIDSHIKEHAEKFSTFLDNVVEISPDINNVQGVLERYRTLEHCRSECKRLLTDEMKGMLEMKRELNCILEEKVGYFKKLKNSLAMLTVRKKKANDHFNYWDRTLKRLGSYIQASKEHPSF
ncbi:hypothetical protein J6590_057893 [Homalodisca vitripennis]|nr:hypothetical protein J6590_057893 [Homalodisca vitripennis]